MPRFLDAIRRLSRVPLWYSWSPCEKLKRAMFMPFFSISSSTETSLDTGPRVQMILVLNLWFAGASAASCCRFASVRFSRTCFSWTSNLLRST